MATVDSLKWLECLNGLNGLFLKNDLTWKQLSKQILHGPKGPRLLNVPENVQNLKNRPKLPKLPKMVRICSNCQERASLLKIKGADKKAIIIAMWFLFIESTHFCIYSPFSQFFNLF